MYIILFEALYTPLLLIPFMPLLGETVWWVSPENLDPNYTTVSWQINIPPSHAFAKIYLHRLEEYGYPDWASPGRANVLTLLFNIRRQKPDGSDEQIDFPTSGNMVVAQYDDNLTCVTYGAIFASAAIEISLVLDYWG
jgi:hypothetical protein